MSSNPAGYHRPEQRLSEEDTVHDSESDLDGPLEEDRDVLLEEEEREKLLSRSVLGFGEGGSVRIGKKVKGRRRDGLGRKLFEPPGPDESLIDSENEAIDDFFEKLESTGKPRAPSLKKVAVITAGLITFLIILIFGSLQLSLKTPKPTEKKAVLTNGTHVYNPTTILISLDGFRSDFLTPELAPTMRSFRNSGVSAAYMKPSFPSVTFPNHWTLVTGLYPESHGIVGNSFWDPNLKREFYYTDPGRSMQVVWWGGEPIWATAEKQGVKSAIHMWPGSELPRDQVSYAPTYVDKFKKKEKLSTKVESLLNWLDLPLKERPQLLLTYVPDVDSKGHKFGPNTTEVRNSVKEVDAMVGSILHGIEERNLTDIVNLVIVSDHGMATTDKSRLIHFEEILPNSDRVEHIDGWPLYGLRPKPGISVEALHKDLVASYEKQPLVNSSFHDKPVKPWSVYLRDKDMPERWHFSKNDRIAPLWVVPETGWAIVNQQEYPKKGEEYSPRGLHGYDNDHPMMRSIFVGYGPLFSSRDLHGMGREWQGLDHHTPTGDKVQNGKIIKSTVVEPFTNVEVYNILCESLGLTPAPNNGTLGGVSGFKVMSPAEAAKFDPVADNIEKPSSTNTQGKTSSASATNAPTATENTDQKKPPVPTESSPTPDGKDDDKKKPDDDKVENTVHKWWNKLKDKTHKIAEKIEHWWQRVWVEDDS